MHVLPRPNDASSMASTTPKGVRFRGSRSLVGIGTMTKRTIPDDWAQAIDDIAVEFHKRPAQVLSDLLEYSSLCNLREQYEEDDAR